MSDPSTIIPKVTSTYYLPLTHGRYLEVQLDASNKVLNRLMVREFIRELKNHAHPHEIETSIEEVPYILAGVLATGLAMSGMTALEAKTHQDLYGLWIIEIFKELKDGTYDDE